MQLVLVKKKKEAKNTKSFFFKPVKPFNWIPGEFLYITIPKLNHKDTRGSTRHFTIANSPTENKYIQITTRIREGSGFKKTLDELEVGDAVEGKGPQGSFIFKQKTFKENNHVFLAGGIGITPFRSVIKRNIDKSIQIPIHLIYSNSDNEFVFKKELDSWEKENDFLKIDYINTSKDGRINKDKLLHLFSKKDENDMSDTKFWIVGPPAFVSAIEEIFEKMKIKDSSIETEKFSGY
ncbi:FAD-dependent oxidoreductase [Candidatus Microgenomates bacterium]|nr:FAD-dependent oxidoreductase [Candidatus Microgenomates bacterium]